jgi:hypothetical protein
MDTDEDAVVGEAAWQITHESLAALEGSPVWVEWAVGLSFSIAAEEIYGPEGKLRRWGMAWPTAEAMTSTLYNNMGGGVPAAVVDELVRLSAPK